jgi:hypothetical protein
MNATRARLSLFGALVAAAIAQPSGAADAASAHSATGAGHYEFTSESGITALRTFAFRASTSRAGAVTGQAQVNNRATGQTLHIQIDCLNVIGNIAILSGTAIRATGPDNSDGDSEILAVEDNGQGAASPPDRVTRAFGNSGFVCTDITPTDIAFVTSLLNDIDKGNIQIQ